MKLNPEYVDMAVKRWEIFTERKAILEGTEKNFEEVAEERKNQSE